LHAPINHDLFQYPAPPRFPSSSCFFFFMNAFVYRYLKRASGATPCSEPDKQHAYRAGRPWMIRSFWSTACFKHPPCLRPKHSNARYLSTSLYLFVVEYYIFTAHQKCKNAD
jgi:hypothetical protein